MTLHDIRPWVIALLDCTSLDALSGVLQAFSNHTWTLAERQLISNVYTPRVKKLAGGDDLCRWLEDLAALCWKGQS